MRHETSYGSPTNAGIYLTEHVLSPDRSISHLHRPPVYFVGSHKRQLCEGICRTNRFYGTQYGQEVSHVEVRNDSNKRLNGGVGIAHFSEARSRCYPPQDSKTSPFGRFRCVATRVPIHASHVAAPPTLISSPAVLVRGRLHRPHDPRRVRLVQHKLRRGCLADVRWLFRNEYLRARHGRYPYGISGVLEGLKERPHYGCRGV